MVNILGLDIEYFGHDGFRIKSDRSIFIDPFKISTIEKVDLILITHEHFDHCSPDDVLKITGDETDILAPAECQEKLREFNKVTFIKPGESRTINGIKIEAVPAYNIDKFKSPGIPYHPKEDDKLGFIITVGDKRIYHTGDSDFIPEMKDIKDIDIAFLPVSGTYVMTAEEAAKAVEAIKPKIAIPMHYGVIVGSSSDAEKFKGLVKSSEAMILG